MGAYDLLSATKENYDSFVEKLVSGLKNLRHDGLSLMLHGSYMRGNYIPGVSDIDALLVFPEDVVTDKEKVSEISVVIANALRDNPVDFQVCPLDATIIKNPPFHSLGESWKGYLETSSELVLGPDYRPEFRFMYNVPVEAGTVAHNLRKTRKSILLAEHNKEYNPEKFFRDFMTTLRAVSSCSKQFYFLLKRNLKQERFSGIETLKEILPGLDTEPLERIKRVYSSQKELRRFREFPGDMTHFWHYSLTFLEEQVRQFIREYPCISDNLKNP